MKFIGNRIKENYVLYSHHFDGHTLPIVIGSITIFDAKYTRNFSGWILITNSCTELWFSSVCDSNNRINYIVDLITNIE